MQIVTEVLTAQKVLLDRVVALREMVYQKPIVSLPGSRLFFLNCCVLLLSKYPSKYLHLSLPAPLEAAAGF